MSEIVAPALSFLAVIVYAYYGLAARRTAQLWPLLIASFAFGWTMPGLYPRLIAVGLTIVFCAKGLDLVRGSVRDPAMLESLPRFMVWLIVPPESSWSPDRAAIDRNRMEGWTRLRRALPKLAVCAALLWIHALWPAVHRHPWWSIQWNLWMLYAALSALADVVTGIVLLLGFAVAEVFDAPPLARSPRDFWSRRWNLYVHDVAYRHVFARFGGLRHPLRATLGVFAASGLMHEYLVWAVLGHRPQHAGAMLAFFLIHGVAVTIEIAWTQHDRARRRRAGRPRARLLPTGIAIPLHQLWMTATAPLFFAALAEIFRGAGAGPG